MSTELPSDIEIDQMVASSLNDLVDQEVLPTEKVSSASAEMIDEYVKANWATIVNRYDPSTPVFLRGFDSDELDKVSRRFGIGEGDQENRNEVERIEGIFEKIINRHKEEGIFGFILYGSRIDPDKVPTKESDLDVEVIIDPDKFKGRFKDVFRDWIEEACALVGDNGGFPFPINYDPDTIKTREEFEEFMEGEDFEYIPIWAWKPNGFRFIGDESGVVNDRLRAVVSSRKMLESKRQYIEEHLWIPEDGFAEE